MSRHRLVKALDLDEELDVYEGDAPFEEEYDPDAEKQLREGTAKVRAVLGDEFPEAEIRDSLWHYYYDVEKSVNYLLSTRSPPKSKKKATPKKAEEGGAWMSRATYSRAQPVQNFFQDSPWLNVPCYRRAEIFVEPVHPRAGLLGGSSNPPKQSKLGALAAARKRKENQRPDQPSTSISNSVALLDKLNLKPSDGGPKSAGAESAATQPPHGSMQRSEPPRQPRKYLSRKRTEAPPPVPQEASEPDDLPSPLAQSSQNYLLSASVLSDASPFAQTLLGPEKAQPSVVPERPIERYDVFPERYAENPFAGPSPDDIVAQAQSASKGLNNAKASSKPQSKDKPLNGLKADMARTAISEAPRIKSKNLDVIAEYEKTARKNTANFVVVGHVDAGKSTLMGRLLQELSVVDQRTIEKYQRDAGKIGKSSFALAWVMDEGSEERSRGVTIDVATNRFETATTVFTILDAPGHRDFVPNMIAGASRADFAVLVLDASTNNFESGLKGQTKEHALLVRSLGVQRIVAAVNKLDSVSWSRDRFDEVTQQTSSFLTAAGFQASNVTFIPCSGLQGENIAKRSTLPGLSWFTGTSLLDQLEAAASPRTYPLRGPLRMPIADIVTGGQVYPLSVSGRLGSGTLQVGDPVVAVPSNATGYIRALEVDSAPTDYAVAGQNATLHVSELDAAQLRPGDIICSPRDPIQAKKSFTLKALAFSHLTPMYASIIAGRTDVQGRVDGLLALLDKATGQVTKKKPRIVKPGEVVRLKVTVDGESGVPVEEGARVVLRAEGETIATGLVE